MSRPFALSDAIPTAATERTPFRAQLEGDTLELAFYEDIVDSWTAGFGFGICADQVRHALKASPQAKRIRARLNSVGGDAVEGSAIYQMLADHPSPVDVIVDGMACSAAFTIAMAGDTISVAAGGMMMLHDAWTVCRGNEDDLKAAGEMAGKVSASMAKIYAARSGKTEAEVRALMKATTWLTATEAVAAGFATAALSAKAVKLNASARSFAAYGFKNVPDHVRAMFCAPLVHPTTSPTVSVSAKDLMPDESPLTRPLTAPDREVMSALSLNEDEYRDNLRRDAESQTSTAGAHAPAREPARHEPSAANASLVAALGGSSVEDALAKLHSLQQQAATGIVLSRAVLDTQASDLIRQAMAGEGKFARPCLTPAAEHTAREFYQQYGMEALGKFLAALPPLAITGEYPRPPASRGSDPVHIDAYDPNRPLSAQDREVMAALSLSEDEYRANLQVDAKAKREAF